MGPALIHKKIMPFLGVKGGVGCSILVSLLGRVLSKEHHLKIGIIDPIPYLYSPHPAYLSIKTPKHSLSQLLPYRDHLSPQMLENYFSASPEGALYMPITQNDEAVVPFGQLIQLFERISQWHDLLLVDLSGVSLDQHLTFIEKGQTFFFISSLEPSSIKALHQMEQRLLSHHFQVQNFNLILNQQNPAYPFPPAPQKWAQYLRGFGNVPYFGENLSMKLFEDGFLTIDVEKKLGPIARQFVLLAGTTGENPEPHPATPRQDPAIPPSQPSLDEESLGRINQLHQKLLEELGGTSGLKGKKYGDGSVRDELEPAAKEILARLIQEMDIPDREARQKLMSETLNLSFGLGPLEALLRDEAVTEIMVNGPGHVYVEKNGLLEKSGIRFLDDQQLRTVIERILAPIGRRIDESQPYVDGRLSDGSRINAVIPPLSLVGPVLTIRKFSKRMLNVPDLLKLNSLTQEAADFLGACVKAKKNIVVSGGTGSGKTTLLNILSNYIPADERIVTIEDSAELQLSQEHVIPLECRPANLEGKGLVTIRDLVMNALRMRPDRIVVGECRGGETLDMLQAMNTGHDGSLTTAHANSPRDALSRLETMSLFTGLELPLKAIREQIARAIHIIVQQSRLPGGRRAITQITEIQGMEGEVIVSQDIFNFDMERGLVRRSFAPTFIQDLNGVGYEWPGHSEKTRT